MGQLFHVSVLSLTVLAASWFQLTDAHGRLISPASRSSMWRYFPDGSLINYSDNQLFCGGAGVQQGNGGKCICGDNFADPPPRANENGGKYGKGKIAATYNQGEIIEVTVQITAHHKGWFEFNICRLKDANQIETQECMDEHLLELQNGDMKYELPNTGSGDYKINVQLPEEVSCDQCVFRWRYHTGNSWGCDATSCATGKGPQEEFYGCSDITIIAKDSGGASSTLAPTSTPAKPSTTSASTPGTTTTTTSASTEQSTTASTTETSTTSATTTTTVTPGSESSTTVACVAGTEIEVPNNQASERKQSGENVDCMVANGPWKMVPGLTTWCRNNCLALWPHCPVSHCRCFIVPECGDK